jgi:hypothetical protein
MFKKIFYLFLPVALMLSACGTLKLRLEWVPSPQPGPALDIVLICFLTFINPGFGLQYILSKIWSLCY